MRRIEKEKADHSGIASGLWRETSNLTEGNGLSSNLMAKGLPVAERRVAGLHNACADGGERRPSWANMPVPLRSKRCGGGSPQQSSWRMTAAPLNVAFSFGGIRTHGLIAPALYRFCGLMPCGEPLRSPSPTTRFFQTRTASPSLWKRESGFRQSVVGAQP